MEQIIRSTEVWVYILSGYPAKTNCKSTLLTKGKIPWPSLIFQIELFWLLAALCGCGDNIVEYYHLCPLLWKLYAKEVIIFGNGLLSTENGPKRHYDYLISMLPLCLKCYSSVVFPFKQLQFDFTFLFIMHASHFFICAMLLTP